MYNFDTKNIVPKESLTCLVAKATLDESMLWHRRLGHINFKNINKLVKDNLDVDNGKPQTANDAQKQVENSSDNKNAAQDKFEDDSNTKDVNAAGQHTRRMTKPTSEQGFLSNVYEQKTHDTLNTCLYACFLSQIEPTSIAKALSDSSWVEAMQEELSANSTLQCKKQTVLPPLQRSKCVAAKLFAVDKYSGSKPIVWNKGYDYIKSSVDKESPTSSHAKRVRDTKIPQSSVPLKKVGDEAVHKEFGDKMERAATTLLA
ncbi:ribonuclease H-like domain-containing protein [Tanacetum coccineum]